MERLSSIAHYVTDKISSNNISLKEYVTTDCMLLNKKGRECATNLPPQPCSLTHYKPNDVLVANIRPYLKKIWYADMEGGASTDVLVFRAKEGHSPEYLYVLLLQDSFFDYVMQGTKGSKMPRGDKSQIMRYEVLKPKTTEKVIGTFFLNINRQIRLNEQINRNLEAIIKDITDYLFLSKKEKLNTSSIGEIASIKAGGDCPDDFSLIPTKDCFIPIYSNGTVNEGLYGYTSRAIIKGRSITVAARGTIGFCVRRYGEYAPIIRLLSVCPFELGADTYLHQIISRMTFKKNGSVQQQLTVPELSAIRIPYPSKEDLLEYDTITYPLILQINCNKKENDQLCMLRDELLPLLMNGQVEVKQLNSDLSLD